MISHMEEAVRCFAECRECARGHEDAEKASLYEGLLHLALEMEGLKKQILFIRDEYPQGIATLLDAVKR